MAFSTEQKFIFSRMIIAATIYLHMLNLSKNGVKPIPLGGGYKPNFSVACTCLVQSTKLDVFCRINMI